MVDHDFKEHSEEGLLLGSRLNSESEDKRDLLDHNNKTGCKYDNQQCHNSDIAGHGGALLTLENRASCVACFTRCTEYTVVSCLTTAQWLVLNSF